MVNVMTLQLECAKELHETLLIPVLSYSIEAMVWREKGCADGEP